jgi:hypothetical protein
MERIQAISLFPSISASALPAFREVAAELLSLARDEPGTLQYEWFYNADETQCIVHETFADSNAVLAHIANAAEGGGRLAELGGGLRLEILGNPSKELRDALVAWGAPIYVYAEGK